MSELSNYRYIKTIGEGTFGKVKLAIHVLTGEKVAIKILQKNLIKVQKQYQRIQNEIKYLKLLNHPNIIKIYEVIENDFSFFIIMEYAPGGELFNYIVLKEKLSENETSFFFYQILQGVRKIHENKICHRDIKPENLLLANKNLIKIIDFGLSSEYDEVLATPCGSPCYASPEMIMGKKYKGLSVDLWACGVILFAMLFGYLPFDDKDNNILFKKIIDCDIDYPEENDIDVGKSAIDLINKILNPDPEKRIGIDEIEKHPFLEYGKKHYENIFKPENFTKEELIISYMENELGFDNSNNIIENAIYNNRHNHITTTFYLLKKKCLEGRLVFSFRQRLYKKISKRKCLLENNYNKSYANSDLDNNQVKNINNINNYQGINNNNDYKNNNIQKKSKTASRSESKKDILSLKDIFSQKEFSDNRNNIIIINNTNMINEPEKINSVYNNMILKKPSLKNINKKIETSVSQEKRTTNNKEKDRNSTYIKSAKTYRSNMKKDQIKVCLKKSDKNGNKFIYFKKINMEDSNRGKFIKLPLNNYSFRAQRGNVGDILFYQKNSKGNQTFRRYINNIHSFDGNISNNLNFNSSISNQNLNGFSSFEANNITNSNINEIKMEEKNKSKHINKKLLSNDIFDNRHKAKFSYKTTKIKLDLNKRIDLKDRLSNYDGKTNFIKKKEKNHKNIDKISRIIFQQNKKGDVNYINNDKKTSYDNNINNKKKEHKKNEIIINLNNSKNELLNQNSNRYNRIIKSINTFNINNLSNKIIDKNLLTKKINCYFIPSNKTKINKIKAITNNDINLMNDKIKKNKKIQGYKNLSPDIINNITYENLNINNFKKINKTNKINNNIRNIIFSNKKTQKSKIKNETNLYNIFKTEKNLPNSNINYIPITSRNRKSNHSRNENFEDHNTKFESNTVFLDLAPNSKNEIISTVRDQRKETNEIPLQRNSVYSKHYIMNKKNNKNTDKFLVANTEMTLYQIINKIDAFCKENNLNYKKEGIYKIKIYKNIHNFFRVEIVHSTPMNIVKIIRGINTGNNMKDIITKLFIDIINFE